MFVKLGIWAYFLKTVAQGEDEEEQEQEQDELRYKISS